MSTIKLVRYILQNVDFDDDEDDFNMEDDNDGVYPYEYFYPLLLSLHGVCAKLESRNELTTLLLLLMLQMKVHISCSSSNSFGRAFDAAGIFCL